MKNNIFEKEWKALGTDIYVQILNDITFSGSDIERIFLGIRDIYTRQEKIFSRFDGESELSQINIRLGEFVEASPEMLFISEKSIEYFQESERIFDPRILDTLEKIGYEKSFQENNFEGTVENIRKVGEISLKEDLQIKKRKVKFLRRMDFSGIVKGYITDRIADFLRQEGFKNFLVDSGGDIYASGKDRGKNRWGIALEGSKDENKVMLELSDEAVATSGNVRKKWERDGKKFHHLINPHQPDYFSFDLQSVTVVEKTAEKADFLAKYLFLLGLEKGLALADKRGSRAFFLKANGEIIKSNHV
jgi:thiamine biosynthesis lipoprotein